MRLSVLVLVAGSLVATGAIADDAVAALESRALDLVGSGNAKGWADLRASVAAVSSATRRDLQLRVRSDEIEFRFAGHYSHGGPLGKLLSLEYLAALPKTKEWETVIHLEPAALARLGRLWAAIGERVRGDAARPPLRVQLAWVEDGEVRVEDVRDMLAPNSIAEQKRFWTGLRFSDRGLGSGNQTPDTTRLPLKPTRAQLLFVIRLPDS